MPGAIADDVHFRPSRAGCPVRPTPLRRFEAEGSPQGRGVGNPNRQTIGRVPHIAEFAGLNACA